ncbi:MAG TPA: DNA-directed RNA polymerase subunit beta, partial [Myxococcota bacterium]|nr:DNA-directed RNA polymerase subunit beta [Myxococcota bacterium]
FMPYYGYNFEDAIVISEKLVKDDVFTSIHIQELELHVRDTKRGMEEITREIPNVAEESLVDLDERGIVRVGARVNSGDILCGKITPKGETELSPEEKLLTAIFGEKAKDVKDSSLRVPPGMTGTVIDVKIFSRRIDDALLEKEHGGKIADLRIHEKEEVQRVTEARNEELQDLLMRQTVTLMLKKGTVDPYLEEGTKLNKADVEAIDFNKVDLSTIKVQNKEANEKIRRLIDEAQSRIDRVRNRTEEQIDKVFQPDELPPGVVQLVKVYLAEKRKISVGDKMAGRHGNKGIIARIAPEEDMPFLPDGTPVEIVLNPLGVPSRMNVGQILETHLGWAARILGFEAKTPVFQGATEDEIGVLLRFSALKWAEGALSLRETSLDLDVEDLERAIASSRMLEGGAIQRVGDSRNGNGNGAGPESKYASHGLGRTLDEFTDLKLDKATKEVFDGIHKFVVAAAKEIAERQGEELEEIFPKVAEIQSKRTAGEGLDEAATELVEYAGIFPSGKVWLRDGRSGRRFDFP